MKCECVVRLRHVSWTGLSLILMLLPVVVRRGVTGLCSVHGPMAVQLGGLVVVVLGSGACTVLTSVSVLLPCRFLVALIDLSVIGPTVCVLTLDRCTVCISVVSMKAPFMFALALVMKTLSTCLESLC